MSQAPPPATLASLKAVTLPGLLVGSASSIGEFGGSQRGEAATAQLAKVMETGAVSRLAEHLETLLHLLKSADPQRVVRSWGFFQRFMGRDLEEQARFQYAQASIETVVEEAQAASQEVRKTIEALEHALADHQDEVAHLKVHIQAGHEFLAENPAAGLLAEEGVSFDSPRERLERRLANLQTLAASHAMSISQFRLSIANALSLLDRFSETVSVLLPVWRQHQLSLSAMRNADPNTVAEASKAHQALLQDVSQTLDVAKS